MINKILVIAFFSLLVVGCSSFSNRESQPVNNINNLENSYFWDISGKIGLRVNGETNSFYFSWINNKKTREEKIIFHHPFKGVFLKIIKKDGITKVKLDGKEYSEKNIINRIEKNIEIGIGFDDLKNIVMGKGNNKITITEYEKNKPKYGNFVNKDGKLSKIVWNFKKNSVFPEEIKIKLNKDFIKIKIDKTVLK